MEKPEKIKAGRDPQGYLECHADGHNQAIDKYEKFLPSLEDIKKILEDELDERFVSDKFLHQIAQRIFERIGGAT